MDEQKKKLKRGKQFVFFCAAVVLILLLVECSLRLFFVAAKGSSFFKPSEIVLSDYPELRQIIASKNDTSSRFKILILSSSVFVERFGHVPSLLEERLRSKKLTDYVLYNASDIAQTTRDSYIKHNIVSEQNFDAIVIYDGMNETRANNCPPALFKKNYSHYAWYETRNLFVKYRSMMDITVIPYSIEYFSKVLLQSLYRNRYLPIEAPRPDWIPFGAEIKTAASFQDNIETIIHSNEGKKGKVILMTFAYYIPYNYSNKAFLDHALDYFYTEYSWPVQIWGNTQNVVLGIDTHNAIIRKLASAYPFVEFIDMENIIPKKGEYFSDASHLSPKGSQLFAEVLANKIEELYRKKKQ